ncbi:MAG TPA: DNA polymerase III subunit beta [Fimbriimonadales bacterium]|jgi:DNA polymerase-3 subunit beta|nr:DNA polymerase III subunit beta [Fimbriimonadales bacterium]
MIFDSNRKEFYDAASLAASPSTGRATTVNLYKMLLIEAGDNNLKITGCDGEMWVERTIPTMVSAAGSAALDAKLLLDILGSMPDGDIHVEQPNGSPNVNLTIGSSDYRIVGADPQDYPPVPEITEGATITIKSKEIDALIDSVAFAVSSDNQARQVLSGILFDYDGDTIRAVATDTHRLAHLRTSSPGIGTAVSAIVPARVLNVIKKLPVGPDSELQMSFGDRRMMLQTDGIRIVAQMINGQFPPYERVIPSECTRKWLMDRIGFRDCLKRCAVLARDNSGRVILKSDGDKLTLSARSEGIGEVKEELQLVRKDGEDTEIAFNGAFLLDALEATSTEGIQLEMTENDRAAVLRPSEAYVDYLCVIMPMALV